MSECKSLSSYQESQCLALRVRANLQCLSLSLVSISCPEAMVSSRGAPLSYVSTISLRAPSHGLSSHKSLEARDLLTSIEWETRSSASLTKCAAQIQTSLTILSSWMCILTLAQTSLWLTCQESRLCQFQDSLRILNKSLAAWRKDMSAIQEQSFSVSSLLTLIWRRKKVLEWLAGSILRVSEPSVWSQR